MYQYVDPQRPCMSIKQLNHHWQQSIKSETDPWPVKYQIWKWNKHSRKGSHNFRQVYLTSADTMLLDTDNSTSKCQAYDVY